MLSTSPFRVAHSDAGTEGGKRNVTGNSLPFGQLSCPARCDDGRSHRRRQAGAGAGCVILGHHYQRDEVIKFADFRGDSYKLSQQAAQAAGRYIVFCGVHFMAESADILGRASQQVVLPDLNAGCSMADMAEIGQVEDCWEQLVDLGMTSDSGERITPITYMNSTAAIKAFCGERGGLVCTSSNAAGAFRWAFAKTPKVFFLPDQHLGRNTGYAMGIPLERHGGLGSVSADGRGHAGAAAQRASDPVEGTLLGAPAIFAGACGQRAARYPGIRVIVHPECRWEVCQKADALGSTEKLIKLVEEAPAGSKFAIGTEIHLVNRLAKENPDKMVITLDDSGCLCTTMFRISPQHLCWALENLVEGNVVNRIVVKEEVKYWARVALDRMLEIQ